MVIRVSKTRNPFSANGQNSSGDALLYSTYISYMHSIKNTTHRQMHTDRRRKLKRDKHRKPPL
jgi:hypothetical protein